MGEIELNLQINQKKRAKGDRTLKVKFDAQFEFLKKADAKKNKDKQFHIYIFEELLLLSG